MEQKYITLILLKIKKSYISGIRSVLTVNNTSVTPKWTIPEGKKKKKKKDTCKIVQRLSRCIPLMSNSCILF